MTEDLAQFVDKAAAFSLSAKSAEAKELAERKRKEARERCNMAIAEIGRLIAKLNKADEL